jgi:hypothetical protein
LLLGGLVTYLIHDRKQTCRVYSILDFGKSLAKDPSQLRVIISSQHLAMSNSRDILAVTSIRDLTLPFPQAPIWRRGQKNDTLGFYDCAILLSLAEKIREHIG